MLVFRCQEGHQYGVAGRGEDLTNGLVRMALPTDCPMCCARSGKPDDLLPSAPPERDPAIVAHAEAEQWFTDANRCETGPFWRSAALDLFRAVIQHGLLFEIAEISFHAKLLDKVGAGC